MENVFLSWFLFLIEHKLVELTIGRFRGLGEFVCRMGRPMLFTVSGLRQNFPSLPGTSLYL